MFYYWRCTQSAANSSLPFIKISTSDRVLVSDSPDRGKSVIVFLWIPSLTGKIQGIYYFEIPGFAAQQSQTSLNSRGLRDLIFGLNLQEQGISGN